MAGENGFGEERGEGITMVFFFVLLIVGCEGVGGALIPIGVRSEAGAILFGVNRFVFRLDAAGQEGTVFNPVVATALKGGGHSSFASLRSSRFFFFFSVSMLHVWAPTPTEQSFPALFPGKHTDTA